MSFICCFFFFSSRRRHTRSLCDWSSDVCSSDLALAGGTLSHLLQKTAIAAVESYRVVVLLYAVLGVVLALLFTRLSHAAEVSVPGAGSFGIGRSRGVVLRLSGLFALDSFAGGFVMQSV